jgi:4'-phosphopantetheinyl transferase
MPCCWSIFGPIPLTDPASCQVWIAQLGRLMPGHEAVLDTTERARAETYLRAPDRARFVLGASLLKLAVAEAVGALRTMSSSTAPATSAVSRTGVPVFEGSGIEVSVAHSADVVAVALSRAGPLGVDVPACGSWPTRPWGPLLDGGSACLRGRRSVGSPR